MTKSITSKSQSRIQWNIQSLEEITLRATPIDTGRYEVLIAQLAALLYEYHTQPDPVVDVSTEIPEPIDRETDRSVATLSGNHSPTMRSPHHG